MCSYCISVIHRPKGGGARPSQAECCKYCIGNSRCAIGFQLLEVSDVRKCGEKK